MKRKCKVDVKRILGAGGVESWSVFGEGYGPAWDNACQNMGSEDNLQLGLLYFSGSAASANSLLDQLKCENLSTDRSSISCLTFKYSSLSLIVRSLF